ncbi:MAG: type II toxin-antitoxin system RelE/ParE family toxin [Clostridia bacterium]|nr:type II toxin-antitoxin system RelE/ParE family toxin [Clostridia bacterium]
MSDYRAIYEIQDSKITILLLEIGHRRNVYSN